jgi:hypothetical protein
MYIQFVRPTALAPDAARLDAGRGTPCCGSRPRRYAIPDVVEPLAKVALNDSDERVSFLAVRGLALATSAAEAPSTATFRERPDEILQFWRTWTRSNVGVP